MVIYFQNHASKITEDESGVVSALWGEAVLTAVHEGVAPADPLWLQGGSGLCTYIYVCDQIFC